ncbi:50S ribosomal protein L19 [Patescibacteria group bacterium]|nr:50S ribosomal protein L19 [Patescibacteria group bacterium]
MITNVDFVPGDIVRVHQKIKETGTGVKGAKELKIRIQVFEGTVLKIKGRGDNKTFIVRKTTGGIAVERIYPVNSPNIEKVEIKAHSKKKIRRANLSYLRKSI